MSGSEESLDWRAYFSPEAVSTGAARWESELHSLVWLAGPGAGSGGAAEAPADRPQLLRGLPVGVKDVIDTAGIPTEYGSPLFAGRVPAQDAWAVARLRQAGAWVAAKTVTAELAYFAPGPTRNPWALDHTPGGSSMGSAAAVAAGILPVALGTQTNGSIIRPAAFCGVVGVKPTFGRISREGVLSFAPSLDHVGVLAASVEIAWAVTSVLLGEDLALPEPSRPLRLGVVRGPDWSAASPTMREVFDAALEVLGGDGIELAEMTLTPRLAEEAPGVLATIMAVEGWREVGALLGPRLAEASPQLQELLGRGAATDPAEYRHAREAQGELELEAAEWISGCDAVITLAALGEAPGLESTGDPRCATRWTLTGLPAVALPCGMGEGGLPLALQLVGHPSGDRELMGIAARLEARLGRLGTAPTPAPAGRLSSPAG